jgi:hypothetical protein
VQERRAAIADIHSDEAGAATSECLGSLPSRESARVGCSARAMERKVGLPGI